MTAPAGYVEATSTSAGTSGSTISVSLPGDPASNDTLVVALATLDTAITPPAGFILVGQHIDVGSNRLGFYRKQTVGNENGTSVEFVPAGSTQWAAAALHITGGQTNRFVVSTTQDGSGSTIDFLEATADWIDYETLWFAVAGWVDDDETVATYPPSYNHSQTSAVSGGGINAGAGVAIATRRFKSKTNSDTPPDLELSASEAWSSFTVAMRPAHIPAASEATGPAGVEASFKLEQDWHDIGEGGIYVRNPISIKHGRSGWSGQPEPSSASMTLDNKLGQWSPDYEGALYPARFKRNTELRIGLSQPDAFLEFVENAEDVYAQVLVAPADVSFDITGDIDVRFELEGTADLTNGVNYILARKGNVWDIHIGRSDAGLNVQFSWADNAGSHFAISSPYPWALHWDRIGVRITLDVSSGTVSFYWSDSVGGTWVLVNSNSNAGATQLAADTGAIWLLSLASPASTFGQIWKGRLYNFEYYNGIDGTLVAGIDAPGFPPGQGGFTGSAGEQWFIGLEGRSTRNRWRFHGEVAAIPTNFALKNDQWIPITANGLLRRLRQGKREALSSIRRGYDREVNTQAVASYWPLEEKGGETLGRFVQAIGTNPFWKFVGASKPASSRVFISSDALPAMATGRWQAVVAPPKSDTDEWMTRFLLHVPADPAGNVILMTLTTDDMVWELYYNSNGTLQIFGTRQGTLVHTGTQWGFTIENQPVRMQVFFQPNTTTPSSLDVRIDAADVETTVTGGGTDTFTNTPASWPNVIELNSNEDMGDIVLGHITVESVVRLADDLTDELTGHIGEPAGERIERICAEEGIDCRIRGNPSDTVPMGVQPVASAIAIIEEAARTDLGALYDSPDRRALGYRTGAENRNQEPVIDVDYDAGDADGVLTPVRDDKDLRNSVSAKNYDGSESRAELTSGPLSIVEPPDGVGRYETSFEVSIANSTFLDDHAGVRMRLSTPNEPRLSSIAWALHDPSLTADELTALFTLAIGDKIGLVDLPPTIYPYGLDQLAQGWTETVGAKTHHIRANTTPASPWDTEVWGEDNVLEDARYDTMGSVTTTSADELDTSLYVTTEVGQQWTTDVNDFPFEIIADGLRVNVTGIAASGDQQVFTVTALARDVAGGADVRLANPSYWSL